MIARLAAVLLVLVAASGCGRKVIYRDKIVEVKVPVIVSVPPLAEVEKKHLPIQDLTEGSTPEQVARAYAESVVILLSETKQHEESKRPLQEKSGGEK